MVNQYFYHQLSDFNECFHNLFDSPRYGVTCIIHDNTCNDSCHLRKDIITCGTHIRKWPHSPCHKNLRLFSFSFWLLFYFLCLDHYDPSSMVLFSSFDVYFLLLTTCVYSLPTCIGIEIFQCTTRFKNYSSSLPQNIANAPQSLIDL